MRFVHVRLRENQSEIGSALLSLKDALNQLRQKHDRAEHEQMQTAITVCVFPRALLVLKHQVTFFYPMSQLSMFNFGIIGMRFNSMTCIHLNEAHSLLPGNYFSSLCERV